MVNRQLFLVLNTFTTSEWGKRVSILREKVTTSMGTAFQPQMGIQGEPHPRNKALLKDCWPLVSHTKALLRPYFLGGWHLGGPLGSHDNLLKGSELIWMFAFDALFLFILTNIFYKLIHCTIFLTIFAICIIICTLRLMRSRNFVICRSENWEPWEKQSQTPLRIGGSQLILRVIPKSSSILGWSLCIRRGFCLEIQQAKQGVNPPP